MADIRDLNRAAAENQRKPPEFDQYGPISYRVIGSPAKGLTEDELTAWVRHFRTVARSLETLRQQIDHREQAFGRRKWRWASVIRGLRRTVDWQAEVLGLEQPGLPKAVEAALKLFRFKPDMLPAATVAAIKKNHGTKEDAAAPLFTEGFLYGVLGKDDARTVLARVRELAEALGMSGDYLHGEDDDDNQLVSDELETEVRRSD